MNDTATPQENGSVRNTQQSAATLTREATGGEAAEAENRLLAALPDAERTRITVHLEQVTLEVLQVLVETGARLEHVYFPLTAVISVVRRAGDGTCIETGTIGREGFVCVAAALGVNWSPTRLETQVPGECARIPTEVFETLLRDLPQLREMVSRFVLAFLDQTSQSVVCNNRHEIAERCARWLLMAHDRTAGDAFALTHETLSRMLGVRRAGVSEAMAALKSQGTVSYRRGKITILNRRDLEAAACECYAINRTNLEVLYSRLGPTRHPPN